MIDQTLKDLKKLYRKALQENQLTTAIKIKELEAKILLHQSKNVPSNNSLNILDDDALANEIAVLLKLQSGTKSS